MMKYLILSVLYILVPFDANAFNMIMVYDPDFQSWFLFQVPAAVIGGMTLLMFAVVYPKLRQEVGMKCFMSQLVIGFSLAYLVNMLLLMVLGALTYGSLIESDPLVQWVALVYFYCMFVYVGWWIAEMSIAKALKRQTEKGVAKPFRWHILLIVAVSYAIAYGYVIYGLRY